MKTIWLFILMIGGVAQLRAQQLTPSLKAPDNSIYQYFKIKPDNNLFKSVPVLPKENQLKTVDVIEPVYNMPVVKLSSDDKMPVAKPWDHNTRYTMLIKDFGNTKADSVLTKAVHP